MWVLQFWELLTALFWQAVFPNRLKRASSSHFLKSCHLIPLILTILGQLSKLPFLAKVLEKVVADQLLSIIHEKNIYEKFRSDFGKKKT